MNNTVKTTYIYMMSARVFGFSHYELQFVLDYNINADKEIIYYRSSCGGKYDLLAKTTINML